MNEKFTLRPTYHRVAMVCLLGMVALQAGFIVMILRSEEFVRPDSRTFAVMKGTFLSIIPIVFSAMSIRGLLAYHRESITIDDDVVHFKGILINQTFGVREVIQAIWRWEGCPSLEVKSRSGAQTILFGNFRGDQQKRLIQYFRERIPHEIQSGWSEVIERYAAEIDERDVAPTINRDCQETWRMSWRGTVYAAPFVFLACGGFLIYLTTWAERNGINEIPNWSGSVALDLAINGALVVAGFPFVFTLGVLVERWLLGSEWY